MPPLSRANVAARVKLNGPFNRMLLGLSLAGFTLTISKMTELNATIIRFFCPAVLLLATLACTETTSVPEADAPVKTVEVAATTEPESEATLAARKIIEEAIAAAGLTGMDEAAFTFRFRDKMYRYQRTAGTYVYERWWTDTTTNVVIRDVLDNAGFVRYTDGEVTKLTTKKRNDYSSSVNSVVYFAFLPWVLRDPAVMPTYLGRDTIKGEALDQIEVRFKKENGGKDADDEFRYWFTPETRQLKYLAYVYPGGKEPRLREANNERRVEGIVVRDYDNYRTPNNTPRPVGELAGAFNRGELELLSEIDLEEVRKREIQPDRQRGDAALNQ